MTIVLKIIKLLLNLANWIKRSRLRANLRKEFEIEGAIVKSKKLGRAYDALHRVVSDRFHADKLREDDGHRRD